MPRCTLQRPLTMSMQSRAPGAANSALHFTQDMQMQALIAAALYKVLLKLRMLQAD